MDVSNKNKEPPTDNPSKRKRKKFKQPDDNNKKSKKRPNFFIGIQITNPVILGKILALQNFITSIDSRFKKSLVSIATTHVTLAVLQLEDDQSIARVIELLESSRDRFHQILESSVLEIHLKMLGDFNGAVLFVNISPGANLDKLKALSSLLVSSCSEFCGGDGRAFKPHVTVMKLSKLYGARKHKVKKIPPYLYSDFSDHAFGTQRATNFQLLSMQKRKQSNGYYHSEFTFSFGSENPSDNRNQFCLHNWAECVGVACITSALYLSVPNVLGQFSNHLSEQAIHDGVEMYKKTQLLKRSKNSREMQARLTKLKRALSDEATKQQIRKELGVT